MNNINQTNANLEFLNTQKKNYRKAMSLIAREIYDYHKISLTDKQFFIRYFQYLIECREQTLTGIKKETYYELQDYFSQFEMKKLFPKQRWQLVFTNTFIKSLYEVSEEDSLVRLVLLGLLSKGKFIQYREKVFTLKPYDSGNVTFPFIYNYLFGTVSQTYLNLAIQIIPQQYPKFDSQKRLDRFEYIHDIVIIDIVPANSKNPILYYEVEKYFRTQYTAPNFFQTMNLVNEEKDYEYKDIIGVKIGEKSESIRQKTLPRKFKPLILNGNIEYVFNETLQKWITVEAEQLYNKKLANLQEFQSNYYIIQKYCITPSTYYVQKIVESIPNFRVKLTVEQIEAISNNGDSLVIGRSGTGKTTCALLKLFTTDTLFKLRMKFDQDKLQQDQIQLKQIDEKLQLKTIFVTASPVLACQVKRLYDKLVNDIQESLNRKKQQKKQMLEVSQTEVVNEIDQSCFEVIQAIKEDQNTENIQETRNDEDAGEGDIDEYEKEMGSFKIFQDLKQFPVFLTLRKLLFLVDSSLMNSYFQLRGGETNKMAQWHNEQLGIMSLNNAQIDLEERQEKFNIKFMNQIDNDYFFDSNTQEVTQELFIRLFWPKIKQKMAQQKKNVDHLDPAFVWAEICTKIKGSEHAHKSVDKFLNYNSYYYIQGKNEIQSGLLYESFLTYEQLKNSQGYYDILDIVNHINYELTHGRDIVEKVHFLILDELQDMPRAVLILLDQITENGLFCCGDNAQNIAKGIEYRFFQVQKCIESFRHDKRKLARKFEIIDLNVNFRSHNKILQLANSVIKILETLYPLKIDKLKKEHSSLNGPKPVVVYSNSIQQLLYNVDGLLKNEKNLTEFGCNQVILVKDQESKGRIPMELQNAIVLTIYEAKGLEFDDVILFNFFADSTTSIKDWSLLNEFEIQTVERLDECSQKYRNQNQSEIIASKRKKNLGVVEFKQLKLSKSSLKPNEEPSPDLCQELKLLYVAITRPKKQLIIFDEPNDKRKIIQELWQKLDIIQLVYPQVPNNEVKFNLEIPQGNTFNWRLQGFKMFRLKCYHSAAKCFKFAGDVEMEKKSTAYSLVIQNINNLENSQVFNEAGQIFESLGLNLRAAQCYFTGKHYQKAYENYAILGLQNEMAEAAYFAQNYEKSAEIFLELGETRRAIECYQNMQQWEKIIVLINQNKSQFSKNERLVFLNKFFPQFLQNIINEIENLEKQTDDLNDNQQQNNQIIQQENSNINDESQSFCVQQSINNETEDKIEFLDIQSNSEEIVQENLDESESFQVENKSSSVEHLSFYDPDDQWLQVKNKSIVRSISSQISQSSNFSNLILLQNSPSFALLNSKKNIFITNNALQKIIQKFQLFSQEFQEHLQNQKSRAIQLSNRDENDKETDHIINFLYDFDNVDIETIYLILDMLEQFQSYKLCLYVCNQFKLANLLGRYLVALASQYTPFLLNKSTLNTQLISNSSMRKSYLEQSAVSQLALRNIFDSINPVFLEFKYAQSLDSSNSFGLQCYKNLIEFGFWKMVIFQLNQENAIKLCYSFGDYESLLQIFQMIQQKRNLDQVEIFEKQKSKYFSQLVLLRANKAHILDLDDIFILTKQFQADANNLQDKFLEQIIQNSHYSKEILSFTEKLQQIESIYINYTILNQKLQIPLEYAIRLFQVLESFHNKLYHSLEDCEAIQTLLFCYGCSLPQGLIMSNYSQFVLIHISSCLTKGLLKELKFQQSQTKEKEKEKNLNINYAFIDIALEYVLVPIEEVTKQIQLYELSLIQSQIHIQSIHFSSQFQLEDYEQSQCLVQEDQENFILQLLAILILDIKGQQICEKIGKKSFVQQKLINWLKKYLENSIENQEVSIFDNQESFLYNFLSRIILKNNYVLFEISNYMKQIIKDMSLQQILSSKKGNHGLIVKVINILNLTNQLDQAIFLVDSLTLKNSYFESYKKYIEFLECLKQNVIEDLIGCYIDYATQVEDRLYPDEQFYLLINIGLRVIISICHYNNQEVLLPSNFLDYLNGYEFIDDLTIRFLQKIYPINNEELYYEYLKSLCEFLEYHCSQYYKTQIHLFLITFSTNLLNVENKYIQTFLEMLSIQEKKIDSYQQITEYLINKQKLKWAKQAIILKLSGINEDQIIKVETCKTISQKELDQEYEKGLELWNQNNELSQLKIKNGKLISSKIKFFLCKQQQIQIQLEKRFNYLRYMQINPKSFQNFLRQNSSNEVIELIELSEKLLKSFLEVKRNLTNSVDIHFVTNLQMQISDIITNLVASISDSLLFLKKIQVEYNKWLGHQSFENLSKLLLDKNRQILAEKWKNLTAGVKLKTTQGVKQRKMQEKKTLDVIVEQNEI